MLFKEFRKTEKYRNASVIYFVNTDGENCEDVDEVIDNMEVVHVYGKNGYLEITLSE